MLHQMDEAKNKLEPGIRIGLLDLLSKFGIIFKKRTSKKPSIRRFYRVIKKI